jgi:hypothetical protein
MKRWQYILFIVAVSGIIGIQFIHPARNISNVSPKSSITEKFIVPDEVHQVLLNSCYDCHSNNTRYPWYANIQPVEWWLTKHINDGKRHLNFDEFASYPVRRQYGKLKEIKEQLDRDEMPLASYSLIHRSSILSVDQKTMVVNWCEALLDTFKAHYPLDSLERKNRGR